MRISEMTQTELAVFTSLLQVLNAEVISTEDLRQAINESKKALEELQKQHSIELANKKTFLGEQEKILSKLEKGNYK